MMTSQVSLNRQNKFERDSLPIVVRQVSPSSTTGLNGEKAQNKRLAWSHKIKIKNETNVIVGMGYKRYYIELSYEKTLERTCKFDF